MSPDGRLLTIQPGWLASASVEPASVGIGCSAPRLAPLAVRTETSSCKMMHHRPPTLLDNLQPMKSWLKPKSVHNDNIVFRVHCKTTPMLLLLCCVLVSLRQYLGDPINCTMLGGNTEAMNPKMLDTYCWIQSTFTVPSRATSEIMPYPGVVTPDKSDDLKYHTYYQWVCFTLFFQAMLFYMPHYLWKMCEDGKCKMLLMNLQSPVIRKADRQDQQKRFTEYFSASLHHHKIYAFRFFCCEVLNFVNVVAQIYFTDLFLGYEFTTYGFRMVHFLEMDQADRPDPMALVFPKMTKCTFFSYGGSGTIQRIDSLCVLPINILNEKIYVLLWFWFTVLAALSGLMLVYRLVLLRIPQLRLKILLLRARIVEKDRVEVVESHCDIGDWFVLQQMGENMDMVAFNELIKMLASHLPSQKGMPKPDELEPMVSAQP